MLMGATFLLSKMLMEATYFLSKMLMEKEIGVSEDGIITMPLYMATFI
jgi:hypothetical protein